MGQGCSCCDCNYSPVIPGPPKQISQTGSDSHSNSLETPDNTIYETTDNSSNNNSVPDSDAPIEDDSNGHHKTIVVHNGRFHADDSLAVYLLHNTDEFKDARVIRTHDEEKIRNADIVCDVGLIYDHNSKRYDHHQPNYSAKFPNCSIPLSSCGLIYLHYGHEIINNLLQKNHRDPGNYLERIYTGMYHKFIKEIDAIDNGFSQSQEKPAFTIQTGISARIHNLNPLHSDPQHRSQNQCFFEAVELIGREFEQTLLYYFDSDIKEYALDFEKVRNAYNSRFEIDSSGQIMLFEEQCNWKFILKDVEKQEKDQAKRNRKPLPKEILFVIVPKCKNDDSWSIFPVIASYKTFRKPLPSICGGLHDQDLSNACGIPGGIFVPKGAFMGIFSGRENIISFARFALQQ